MKDFDYYSDNNYTYLYKSDYLVCDKCETKMKKEHKFCPECGIVSNYNEKIQEYQDHKKLYNFDKQRRYEEFVEDCFEEFDLKNNPNKDNIFAYAWDKGRGYREVYNILLNMEEFKLF